jgi:hypothetical protein
VAIRRRSSVKKSLNAIAHAFVEIERSLQQLSIRVRRAQHGAARSAAAPERKQRRKLRISPKRRAQLKLQGAYMGYMRQLGPRQKAQVKAVKEKRGFEAAIKMARRLAPK